MKTVYITIVIIAIFSINHAFCGCACSLNKNTTAYFKTYNDFKINSPKTTSESFNAIKDSIWGISKDNKQYIKIMDTLVQINGGATLYYFNLTQDNENYRFIIDPSTGESIMCNQQIMLQYLRNYNNLLTEYIKLSTIEKDKQTEIFINKINQQSNQPKQ